MTIIDFILLGYKWSSIGFNFDSDTSNNWQWLQDIFTKKSILIDKNLNIYSESNGILIVFVPIHEY